jgi:hypothetical protein
LNIVRFAALVGYWMEGRYFEEAKNTLFIIIDQWNPFIFFNGIHSHSSKESIHIHQRRPFNEGN